MLICDSGHMMLLQIYGKDNVFDADRLIDLLGAFETFREASQSGRGNMDGDAFVVPTNNTRGHAAEPSSARNDPSYGKQA